MAWTNFHGHCKYCDGVLDPDDYIRKAIEKGFYGYGFSSHGPVDHHSRWNIKKEHINTYLQDIDRLSKVYEGDIEIYKGFEADYIPDYMTPEELKKACHLDYVIGSIHYMGFLHDGTPWEMDGSTAFFEQGLEEIFAGDFKQFVKRYFSLVREMVETGKPDIVGHLDKFKIHNSENRYFQQTDEWYQAEVMEALECIKKNKTILEVNTRGIYKKKTEETYPSPWILKQAHQMNIPVMLNSDAHHPDDIDKYFGPAAQMLEDTGFRTLRILLGGKWCDVPFDHTGLKPDQSDARKSAKLAS